MKILTSSGAAIAVSLPAPLPIVSAINICLTGVFMLSACQKKTTANEQITPAATPLVSQAAAVSNYAYGTILKFDAGGEAKRYEVSGWSTPEGDFTWTDKSIAVLALRLDPSDAPAVLQMTLQGLVKGTELPSQPVEVAINERTVATWEVSEKRTFTGIIPADLIKSGGAITIRLRMPKATSPASIGMNTDQRILGVSAFDLQIATQ